MTTGDVLVIAGAVAGAGGAILLLLLVGKLVFAW